MANGLIPIKVLIGSPGDVEAAAQAVVDHLRKPYSAPDGYVYHASYWRDPDTFPAGWSKDGAQGAINDTILAEADVVIALFSDRLGSEWTAAPDPSRPGEVPEKFASGTAAEVELGQRSGTYVRIFIEDDAPLGAPAPEQAGPAAELADRAEMFRGSPRRERRLQKQLITWSKAGFAPKAFTDPTKLPQMIADALRADIEREVVGRPQLEHLLAFCQQSVRKAHADIGKYDADLFVERSDPERHFAEFLNSDQRALALTGAAGTGKSNQLCSMAAKRAEQHPTFLVRGRLIDPVEHGVWVRLRHLLMESDLPEPVRRRIRRCEPAELPEVLDTWLADWDMDLVIHIDGINEHTQVTDLGERIKQAAETIARCERLRLFVSCRDADWRYFEAISGFTSHFYDPPDNPGNATHRIVMNEFTDAEFGRAWDTYRRRFGFTGAASDRLNELCHDPLMLHFTANAYAGKRLTQGANREDIFAAYLDSVCAEPGQDALRLAIYKLAVAVFDRRTNTNAAEVPKTAAQEAATAAQLTTILGLGIVLGQDRDAAGGELISFKHDAFYEYALSAALIDQWDWASAHNDALDDLTDFVRTSTEYRFLEGTLLYLARSLLKSPVPAAGQAARSLIFAAAGREGAPEGLAATMSPERARWQKFYCALAATFTDDATGRVAKNVRKDMMDFASAGSSSLRYAAGATLGTLISSNRLTRDLVDELETSPEWARRETAAVVLRQLHTEFAEVQQRLEPLADDINWRVRRQAGNTLGDLCRLAPGPTRALMADWAAADRWRLRRAVAQARSGLMADPDFAIDALTTFLRTDQPEDLRWRSVNVLAYLMKSSRRHVPDVLALFLRLAEEDESVWVRRHVAYWLPDLHRFAAARGLADQAAAIVEVCLADPSEHVRWAAIRALGEFARGDRVAASAYVDRVLARDDLTGNERFAALYSKAELAVAADPTLLQPQSETGEGDDWDDWETEVAPLQQLTIRQLVEQRHPDEPLRPQVEELARSIRDPRPETLLNEELGKNDRYTNIQNAIDEAVTSKGAEGRAFYELLLDDEDEGLRWGAAEALSKQPGLDAAAFDRYVATFTQDPQYWVRRACLTALADLLGRPETRDVLLGSTTVVERVLHLCTDDEAEVRFAAVGCLRVLLDSDRSPVLLAALQRLEDDDDRQVRAAAVEALAG